MKSASEMSAEPNTWHRPYRYEQPTFGQFGVVEQIGDKLICHFCGRAFRSVGNHVVVAHGLLADEYREIVGLNRTHSLVGPSTKALKQVAGRKGKQATSSPGFQKGNPGHVGAVEPRPELVLRLAEKRAAREAQKATRFAHYKSPEGNAHRVRGLVRTSKGRTKAERDAIAVKAVAAMRKWLVSLTPEQYAVYCEQRRVAALKGRLIQGKRG